MDFARGVGGFNRSVASNFSALGVCCFLIHDHRSNLFPLDRYLLSGVWPWGFRPLTFSNFSPVRVYNLVSSLVLSLWFCLANRWSYSLKSVHFFPNGLWVFWSIHEPPSQNVKIRLSFSQWLRIHSVHSFLHLYLFDVIVFHIIGGNTYFFFFFILPSCWSSVRRVFLNVHLRSFVFKSEFLSLQSKAFFTVWFFSTVTLAGLKRCAFLFFFRFLDV